MQTEYILLICAGGVFGFLLFMYMLIELERWKRDRKIKKSLEAAYADKNLAKMEYDMAFYDDEAFLKDRSADNSRQVTIDDVLNPNDEEDVKQSEKALFVRIESVENDVLVGNYKPE